MMSSNEIIIGIIVVILLIIGIFFLLRQFFTWYWKINEQIALQKETNAYLKQLIDLNKNHKTINNSNENN